MEIMPTLLERSSQSLMHQIVRLSPYFSAFQIDVVDGVFAPNKTPFVRDLLPLLDLIPKEIRENISFDYHLMTGDYEREIKDILNIQKTIKVRNILVHSDLSPNYRLMSSTFPQFTFGAVLNSEDNVYEVMKNYEINTFPIIQFMTVRVGAQGNPFIAQVLTKIEQIKKAGFRGKIYLDGGVNKETVPYILSKPYQPDVLCVGSFLTHSETLPQDVEYLFDLLRDKKSE